MRFFVWSKIRWDMLGICNIEAYKISNFLRPMIHLEFRLEILAQKCVPVKLDDTAWLVLRKENWQVEILVWLGVFYANQLQALLTTVLRDHLSPTHNMRPILVSYISDPSNLIFISIDTFLPNLYFTFVGRYFEKVPFDSISRVINRFDCSCA